MGLLVERRDKATIVTFGWPAVRNALNGERLSEVVSVVRAEGAERGRCLVLTGQGAFCAGADYRSVEEASDRANTERGAKGLYAQEVIRAIVDTCIPVIAAIDGPAIGLGMDIALACDDRLIGENGWLMQGWGRLGLIPGTGGNLLLRTRNPGLGWRLLAYQDRIGPEDAERWGLGTAVIGRPAVEAAEEMADLLAGQPPATLSAYVDLSRSELRARLPEHLQMCADLQVRLLASPELRRRLRALQDGSSK